MYPIKGHRLAIGYAFMVVCVVVIVIIASAISYYSAPVKTTTVVLTETSTVTSTSIGTVTTTSLLTVTSTVDTVALNGNYSYLSSAPVCGLHGYFIPCFGAGSPYVFSCAQSAATTQGCTQVVVSPQGSNYTIDIRYPLINSTTPAGLNCFWSVPGVQPPWQQWAYCQTIYTGSFVVGAPEPPVVISPTTTDVG
jgi:hypothetical protein